MNVGLTPAEEFGARGRSWRLLFGTDRRIPGDTPPAPDELIGRCWHHVLHARAAIERGKALQAELWIAAARHQVVALACLHAGLDPGSAREADLLPRDVTAPVEAALVRSLERTELERALAAVAGRSSP